MMLLLLHLGNEAAGVPLLRSKHPVHCLLKSIPRNRTNHTFANQRCILCGIKAF